MDGWLTNIATDPLGGLALNQALAGAMTQFYAFTLVLIRLSGLMVVGPIFGQSTVPVNVRVLLSISLALLVTPLLADRQRQGFDRLDLDGDNQLSAEEIPPGLLPRYERLCLAAGLPMGADVAREDYRIRMMLPDSLGEYLRVVAEEVVLGLLLGTGILAVLSGLQMAGQLIDQQSGLGLGEILNPDLGGSVSLTGQTLFWLGTVIFLLLAPLGGHLQLVRILAETFDTMPVGEAALTSNAGDVLIELVRQSLLLGLRVAAPVMVMMSLIDLAFGFLTHSVPQINIQAVGLALRALMGTLILTVTIAGVGDVTAAALTETLSSLRDVLVYPR
jgi:flagellar biosynthetic protein FliR